MVELLFAVAIGYCIGRHDWIMTFVKSFREGYDDETNKQTEAKKNTENIKTICENAV